MEQALIEVLNTIKYPGAVVVFIIYGLPKILELIDKKWVKNNLLPKAEGILENIEGNHLHEIKECLRMIGNKLDVSNKTLERIEGTLNENSRDTAYIKAKITNGK